MKKQLQKRKQKEKKRKWCVMWGLGCVHPLPRSESVEMRLCEAHTLSALTLHVCVCT